MINGHISNHEAFVEGERADLVELASGAKYAVVDPDEIYRAVSYWNESAGDMKTRFYPIHCKRTISKVMNALGRELEQDSPEPILSGSRSPLPKSGRMKRR
jgi:hypothetical protein